MASLGKKVGYLRGLLEGMSFSDGELGGKLLSGIVDVLGELSDQVEDMDDMLGELNDYVESIDDDLSELEGARGDSDDEDDLDFLRSLEEDGFGDFDEDFEGEDQLRLLTGGNGGDDDSLTGAVCPDCGGMSFVYGEADEEALYICPHCREKVRMQPLVEGNAPIATLAEDE